MVTYVRDTAATAELLRRDDVDAVEIHTSARYVFLKNEVVGNSRIPHGK